MGVLNRHATVVLAGDRGVMITGRSGAGKTTLGLALIAHCRAAGLFARLVADDQTYLSTADRRVIAQAPEPIAGLAEAFGAGPAATAHERRAVVDIVVELVETAPRLAEEEFEPVAGFPVPSLRLGERNARGGVFAVAAKLGLPPFR